MTIPANVTLGQNQTITVDSVVLAEHQIINVRLIATGGEGNAFTVKTDRGATLAYEITKDGSTVAIDDTVLSVNPAVSCAGSATLHFSKPSGVQYSGIYKGTVTFTVSVDDIP